MECFERGHGSRHLVPQLIYDRCDSLQGHGLQVCGGFFQQCDQSRGGSAGDFHRGFDRDRASNLIVTCGMGGGSPFPQGTRTEPRKGTDSLSKGERTGWERERSSGRVSLRDAIPKGDWGSETDRTGMDPPGQPGWVEKGEKERDASGRGGGQAPGPRWTKVQAKEGVEDGQRSQGSCRYPRAVRGDA